MLLPDLNPTKAQPYNRIPLFIVEKTKRVRALTAWTAYPVRDTTLSFDLTKSDSTTDE